jgi:hypothetical protein
MSPWWPSRGQLDGALGEEGEVEAGRLTHDKQQVARAAVLGVGAQSSGHGHGGGGEGAEGAQAWQSKSKSKAKASDTQRSATVHHVVI